MSPTDRSIDSGTAAAVSTLARPGVDAHLLARGTTGRRRSNTLSASVSSTSATLTSRPAATARSRIKAGSARTKKVGSSARRSHAMAASSGPIPEGSPIVTAIGRTGLLRLAGGIEFLAEVDIGERSQRKLEHHLRHGVVFVPRFRIALRHGGAHPEALVEVGQAHRGGGEVLPVYVVKRRAARGPVGVQLVACGTENAFAVLEPEKRLLLVASV